MPYKSKSGKMERARSTAHVPIVENDLVKERLRSFRVFAPQLPEDVNQELLVDPTSLGPAGVPTTWVMSFDGSPQEVAVREEYPSTRIGYVQVAGVLVHLSELLGQESAHLVDPSVIRAATQEALHSTHLIHGALPYAPEAGRSCPT